MKESKAPNGYEINPDYETGKAITLVEDMDTIKVVNKETIPNSIELTKTDSQTDEPLAGAKFKLEKADGELVSEDHETDANGQFKVTGLPKGDYQFVETAAPAGYQKMTLPLSSQSLNAKGKSSILRKPIR